MTYISNNCPIIRKKECRHIKKIVVVLFFISLLSAAGAGGDDVQHYQDEDHLPPKGESDQLEQER